MRLIDADKIPFYLIDEVGGEYAPYLGCSKEQIDNLPSVTPIRPKGEWETGYTFPDGVYWKCSVCKELIRVRIPMHFCSNCGADMRGENEKV